MEHTQTTIFKAQQYWVNQLPLNDASKQLSNDIESLLKHADTSSKKEGIKLCSNNKELPTMDKTNFLEKACLKNNIDVNVLGSAIMWVYPTYVEVKEFGDRNFRTL